MAGEALSLTVTIAEYEPGTSGLKPVVMVQKLPTARLGGQLLDSLKRLAPVPITAMPEMFSAALPVLVRFTVCVGLEVPAERLAKVMEDELRFAVGVAPVTLTAAQVTLAKAVLVDVVPLSET